MSRRLPQGRSRRGTNSPAAVANGQFSRGFPLRGWALQMWVSNAAWACFLSTSPEVPRRGINRTHPQPPQYQPVKGSVSAHRNLRFAMTAVYAVRRVVQSIHGDKLPTLPRFRLENGHVDGRGRCFLEYKSRQRTVRSRSGDYSFMDTTMIRIIAEFLAVVVLGAIAMRRKRMA